MLYGSPYLTSAFSSPPIGPLAAFLAAVDQTCRLVQQNVATQFVHPGTVAQTTDPALQAAITSEIFIGSGVPRSRASQQALSGSITFPGNTIAQSSRRAQQNLAALIEFSAAADQTLEATAQATVAMLQFIAAAVASASVPGQQLATTVSDAFSGFIVGIARRPTQAVASNLEFLAATSQIIRPAVQALQSDLAFLATIAQDGEPTIQALVSLSGPGANGLQVAAPVFQSVDALQSFAITVDQDAAFARQQALVTLEFSGQIVAAHLTGVAQAQALLEFLSTATGATQPATQSLATSWEHIATIASVQPHIFADVVADIIFEIDASVAQTASPAIQQIVALLPQLIEFERILATIEIEAAIGSTFQISPTLTATIRVRTPT